MAEIADRFQPSFSLFPINNNRTGYQPVNLPMMLVVPHRRTASGFVVGGTEVSNVEFLIEEAPGRAKVAGFQNRGILVPQFERFKIQIDQVQLTEVKIDVTGLRFFDSDGTNEHFFEDAVEGDLMEYTMIRSPLGAFGQSAPGPRDLIKFFPDADYFDMSPFIIETFDLPVGRYRFVWQARYRKRLISRDGEVVCISDEEAKTRFAISINHPGEVHELMRSNSPPLYFPGDRIDRDPTVAFYRPFADALQDIFDEQELLRGVNWIDKIPIQYVPYLAFLIGFDLPYFPSTTDNIRKALLRNGRRLQQLKGSKRVIRELFEIFGFTIDLANLWYSKDGSRFISPNEPLPDNIADQEIKTEDVCHAEPLLDAYNTPGFGQIEIPLLFRPLGNITLDAFLVKSNSTAAQELAELANASAQDIEALEADICSLNSAGFQTSSALTTPSTFVGHSRVLIDQDKGGIEEAQVGTEPPINAVGVKYDFNRNSINVTFDHYLNFSTGGTFQDQVLYVFATYARRKIVLPDALKDLRSNRFDINVLTFKDGRIPSSDIFLFLIEFLFRFKAFHSLLRKIAFTLELDEIYNVQDFCFGGEFAQSPGSDFGNLQVPPAVIPTDDTVIGCDLASLDRGFKDSDFSLRDKIKRLLEIEHETWKSLDDTHQVPADLLPILQSASRIEIRQPESGACQFTQLGQDRVADSGSKDFDHVTDDREKICDLSNNTSDYCYKGRVGQELITEAALQLEEIFRCKPCALTAGVGEYYLTSIKTLDEFSGGDPGTNAADLTSIENYRRSFHDKNYVRIMAFDNPQLNYTDRHFLDDLDKAVNNRFFATRKPSLEIEKDNMHIPGHRFVSMANQESDVSIPDYVFKPWDDIFAIVCEEDIPAGVTIPELNAQIVEGTDGNESLIFDQVSLVYFGNGIIADIPTMDIHSVSAIPVNDIAHSIWDSSNPGFCWPVGSLPDGFERCVINSDSDDQSLRFPIKELGEQKTAICFTDVLDPIFESANRDCPCPSGSDVLIGESLDNIQAREATGATLGDVTSANTLKGADFIDGYPSEFGEFTVDLSEFDFVRETIKGYDFSVYGEDFYNDPGGQEILDPAIAINIPILGTDDRIANLRFKLGSGIRVREGDLQYRFYKPFRLDCGCEQFECDITAATAGSGTDVTSATPVIVSRCPLTFFQNSNGTFDFNCDRAEFFPRMILNESYGAKSCLMDGSIPNMMSFDSTKLSLEGPIDTLPVEGSFQFIDSYGVIYIGMFETFNDKIDITIQIKDPRVPGQDPGGEVINFRVFRDGIITTERQILQVLDDGFIVVAEGSEQKVDRFQTTFGCGDEVFEDPFEYHLDFDIVDEVEMIVTPIGSA